MTPRVPPFLDVGPRLKIPGSEIHLSYATSGGPGGQNVNKVASKAVLRWNLWGSVAPSPADRGWLLSRLGDRLTTEGDLVLSSDRNRDQPRNVEDVLDRLRELLLAALARPTPRRKSRPTRGSKERRLATKKRRSDVKRHRRGPGD